MKTVFSSFIVSGKRFSVDIKLHGLAPSDLCASGEIVIDPKESSDEFVVRANGLMDSSIKNLADELAVAGLIAEADELLTIIRTAKYFFWPAEVFAHLYCSIVALNGREVIVLCEGSPLKGDFASPT